MWCRIPATGIFILFVFLRQTHAPCCMLKPVSLPILVCLFAPVLVRAQSTKKDFSTVDSLARSIRYDNDIYRLTKELTSSHTEQLSKVRAIFIWVTDNIEYDYEFINKGKEIKVPKCKPGVDCRQMREEWESDYLKEVLKKKRGVCDGYARLFRKMCGIAGIPCEIVPGYTKTKPYQIGSPGSLSHAWNAVLIDSAWHFLDVTWASGGCAVNEESGKLLPFRKHFNEYYWFTSFTDLARNHYPKDGKWVLEPGYTKEKFADNPWYAPEILDNIRLISPSSGVVNAKKGDTLHFKFDYKARIKFLQANSNVFRNPDIWNVEMSGGRKIRRLDTIALRRQQYISFTKDSDMYAFDFVVTDESLYYVELLFDYKKVMRFNIKVDSKTL